MRRIGAIGFGVILGAAAMWAAMSYHFLRTKNGFACVSKYRAQLSGTYIDVRSWGITEWTERPELVLTLEQNQRTDIIGDANVLGTTLREAMKFTK